jgi:uncharacterized membrane protein
MIRTPILSMAALGLIMSAMCSTVAQAQLKYHVTAIAPGEAVGINDKGDVAGTLLFPVPPHIITGYGPYTANAFLCKGGKITNLGVYPTVNDPVDDNTEGKAVNNSDVVAGNISDGGVGDPSAGAFDAFSWKNGVMTDIAQGTTDGGFVAYADGINKQGEVVGSYDATEFIPAHTGLFGYPHGYVYLNGVRTDLGTLAGENANYSYGYAINDAGQVVGVSTNGPASAFAGGGSVPNGTLWYAFLWTNGTMKAIGGAQSANFRPAAINDNGWIVGTLNGQAVFYVNNRFIPLGAVKGFTESVSVSMNNLGMVVGDIGGPTSASVFVYDGVMHDLNTRVDGGWTITTVGQINNFGQIAATGTPLGSTVTYALLLTPYLGWGFAGIDDKSVISRKPLLRSEQRDASPRVQDRPGLDHRG